MADNDAESTADNASEPVPTWDLRNAIRAIGHPSITRMILFIYLPFLIPGTVIAALVCRWIDGKIAAWLDSKHLILHWPTLPGFPVNVILWLVLTVIGLTIVWWCYSYLVIVGGGGPAPLVAKGAVRVVIGGPYGISRHPSVMGKLLGVIGLGLLMRSFLFTCILLPLALAVSLYEKKYFMEQRDLAHFGPKYAEYIRRVPFFLPNLEGIKRTIRVYQGQEQEISVLDELVVPDGDEGPEDGE